MLKTTYDAEGVSISYDGHEFGLVPYAPDAIGVFCLRRGEWVPYDVMYPSIAQACEGIFYGTILADRIESGTVIYKGGKFHEIIPLTYYDRAA